MLLKPVLRGLRIVSLSISSHEQTQSCSLTIFNKIESSVFKYCLVYFIHILLPQITAMGLGHKFSQH